MTTTTPEISPLGREILENFDEVCKLSNNQSGLSSFSDNFQKEWRKINDFKKFICKANRSDITNYILQKFHVDFIINLGSKSDKVFKSGNSGQIVIIALSRNNLRPFDETKYYYFPF